MTTDKESDDFIEHKKDKFFFEELENSLSELNLMNPFLKLLEPNSNYYTTLALQICGDSEFGKDNEENIYYVRNKERKKVIKKFKNFFRLARDKKVNLVITPEYSCPWAVIEEDILGKDVIDQNFPEEDNLWVVGCESITQHQLMSIKEKYSENIYWVFEKDKLSPLDNFYFLDPVCYFFKTVTQEKKELVNVVVVQFKTQFMGGNPFEKDHLKEGQKIYILKNRLIADSDSSNYLLTLVCSDTLAVDLKSLPNDVQRSLLILHIQNNEKPFHPEFSDYRGICYEKTSQERGIICLNWARKSSISRNLLEVKIPPRKMSQNSNYLTFFGGSGVYFKNNKLILMDLEIRSKLRENQEKGMYYSFNPEPSISHIHFLNHDEYVFEFLNDKICRNNSSITTQFNFGPLMKAVYKCDESNEYDWIPSNKITEICDLCNKCISSESCFCPLADNNSLTNPIEKELFVALSLGEIDFPRWPYAESIFFLQTKRIPKSNETNQRLTFLHDQLGNDAKFEIMLRFFDLCKLVKDKSKIPNCICDKSKVYKDTHHLKRKKGNNSDISSSNQEENWCLKYFFDEDEFSYLYNLYSEDEKKRASVVYIANKRKDHAERIFRNMRDLFKGSHGRKRVFVWFKGTEGIETISDDKPPKCNERYNHQENSCRKGR